VSSITITTPPPRSFLAVKSPKGEKAKSGGINAKLSLDLRSHIILEKIAQFRSLKNLPPLLAVLPVLASASKNREEARKQWGFYLKHHKYKIEIPKHQVSL
jgi:hypothetical protein